METGKEIKNYKSIIIMTWLLNLQFFVAMFRGKSSRKIIPKCCGNSTQSAVGQSVQNCIDYLASGRKSKVENVWIIHRAF